MHLIVPLRWTSQDRIRSYVLPRCLAQWLGYPNALVNLKDEYLLSQKHVEYRKLKLVEIKLQCCKVIQSGFCQIILIQLDRFGQQIYESMSCCSFVWIQAESHDTVNLTKEDFLFLWGGKYMLGSKDSFSSRVYGKYPLGCQEIHFCSEIFPSFSLTYVSLP